jgi:predicted pyridoxine 5'-phosphate oxidase superfamily flavin-nucleotide-binding protein
MPEPELDDRFSEPGATARPWSEVERVLAESEMFWLSTVRRDGRPHVTPLPAVWHAGGLHVCTGAHEQKAKNLAANPRCVLTTGTNDMRSGLDVVVEGTAARVTETGRLRELAGLWKAKLDWDFQIADATFRDPDGRIGLVYAVAPVKVLAFSKGPYSQTRYRF